MGRAPCCEKVGLKKGRWTAEEDEILTNYIRAHGEGSWRSLPKNAGLLRCGKSCRLRWINYLRSDLKRGNITSAEEEIIVKLHASMGNRWSLIASRLPGRTDNEIKNYWNSHLSRKIDAFRPRLRSISSTQETTSIIMDTAQVNHLPKLKGGGISRQWATKKNKRSNPTNSDNHGKSSGVPEVNASSPNEAAIPLPQTPEMESESLPSLIIKNSSVGLDLEAADQDLSISNNEMTISGDCDKEPELKETPMSSTGQVELVQVLVNSRGTGQCDSTVLSPDGKEISNCAVGGPLAINNATNIDEGGAACFDDILGCDLQDLGDALNDTQYFVTCVGDRCGATCLDEFDMAESVTLSSNGEVSTDWFPCSPMTIAFGDADSSTIEKNSNWKSDEQSRDTRDSMLSWLWEGEHQSGFHERQSVDLDPDTEDSMFAWLLS